MRVLVACEESQAVCKAFRERGHEAYNNSYTRPLPPMKQDIEAQFAEMERETFRSLDV